MAITSQTKFSLSSPANFQEILVISRKVYTCYVDFEKAYDRVSRAKHWGVLRRVRCW